MIILFCPGEKRKKVVMYDGIWNLLYPKCCPVCFEILDDQTALICDGCKKKLKIVEQPFCFCCGKPLYSPEQEYCFDCTKQKHVFDRGFSLVVYNYASAPSILSIKYKNKREFLAFYGQLAKERYEKLLRELNIECIVPVPISRKKYRKRGYNQAELFGREISAWSGLPVKKNLILRRKETAALKELTPMQRKWELNRAFVWRGQGYEGEKTVLLADDIYTSGATADACAGILKKNGIKKVYVLTIAIGIGNG